MSELPNPPEVIRAARTAAAALAAIHAAGELHGAISPAAFSAEGELVNADFVRDYAAPEVILGKPPTAAADVFSFGGAFYFLLTGRHPFEASSPAARLLKICSESPPDPATLRPDAPGELVAILNRCLQRDPAQRFPSAALLRDALAAIQLPGSAHRMLVADDDAGVRALVRNVAMRLSVDADIVESGKEAVAAIKARRYDIMLLDLHMPRIDGWQVLDFLRANIASKPGVVYVITGFRGQQISEGHRDLVDGVIYKPIDLVQIRDLIARQLEVLRVA